MTAVTDVLRAQTDAPVASLLLVDDHRPNLVALEAILAPLGQRIVCASSGQEAIARAAAEDFAVILLDFRMEGMDGLETARRIKELRSARFTPIIFLTAHAADEADASSLYQHGAVDFLRKPLDPATLCAKVTVFVELYLRGELLEHQGREMRSARLGADVGAALTGSAPLDSALRACCEAMVRNLGASFARIWTLDDADRVLELRASAGRYTHLDGPHGRVPVGQLKIGKIASARSPHLTNDVGSDPDVSDPQWAKREGMVSFAGYPLLLQDTLVGVMAMFACEPLTEESLVALGAAADLIALGIARRRNEEELRASEARNAAIIDSALDCIVVIDDAGRILNFNPAAERTFGYPREAVIGLEMAEVIVPPALRERHRRGLAHCVATGEGPLLGKRIEIEAIRADGSELPVELSIVRNAGEPPTFTGYLRDISVRREAEATRARLDRYRDLLLGVVGHDLRGPLSAIIGSTEVVLRREALALESSESLRRTLSSAERMTRMIEQLLDLTRSRLGGGIPLDVRPMDLDEVCHRVIDETRAGHPSARVVFSSMGTGEGEWDADRIAQVISNLVRNAIHHGDPSAEIRVERTGDERNARLAVHNRGASIPPQLLRAIFDPFRRVADDAPSKASGGLGLGLYICQQIVEQHGGAIAVESTEDAGTLFTVTLPRHARSSRPSG